MPDCVARRASIVNRAAWCAAALAPRYVQVARALRGQGRARRPDQALRLDGTRPAGRAGRRHRRPGEQRRHAARESADRSRGDHADFVAPDRQPGVAEDQVDAARAAAGRARARGGAGPSEAASIGRLDSRDAGFDERLARARRAGAGRAIERVVADIVRDVRRRGDCGVLEYTLRFDRIEVARRAALELSQDAAPRWRCASPSATRCRLPPIACALSTSANCRNRGRTSRPTAAGSGSASRRSTGSASMCPAARRRIRRRY